MRTLYLDTTQPKLMMALKHGDEILWHYTDIDDSHRHHASRLLPLLADGVTSCGLTPNDIEAIAMNCGPGSFTGIRTGLAIARTLAQFLPIQLYAFDTFTLIAGQPQFIGQRVNLYLNAFRQQHYFAALTLDPGGIVTWHEKPKVNPNESLLALPEGTSLIEGSLAPLLTLESSDFEILEDLDCSTPEVMHRLLASHAELYRVSSWETLLPLYLQQPHITVKAATPRAV